MNINIRKALLTGTAIIAVGTFVAGGVQAADLSLTATDTWADGGGGDLGPAAAGDNIDITADGADVLVTNDGVSDDGGGVNAFTIGTITDSSAAQDGDLVVTTGAAADMTLGVTAATLDGNVSMTNTANDGDIATTVTGALTAGGTLTVDASDVASADALTLTVGGNTAVTGTTGITAGANAVGGATAIMNVDGAANTFTGAVTVTGGAGDATNDASLVLSGAANTFTNGLTLTNGAAGQAILTLDGASAQTVSGTVAGDGDVNVSNAAGATFSGAVTSTNVLVAGSGANAAATFQNALTTTAVVLGDGAGTDTNTLTLDGTAAGFTAAGTIDGTANDTDNLVVSGGNTIVTSGVIGGVSVIDSLSVTGTGTELDADAAVDATAITIGAGATLDAGAAVTGAVSLSGTLNLTAGGSVVGAVTGASGNLDVDANSSVSGAISNLDAIDIATGATLTAGSTVGATTITLNGTGGFTSTAGNNVAGNFVAAADGDGAITILDAGADGRIDGNIGTATNAVGTLDIQGGAADIVRFSNDVFVDTITVNDADTFWLVGDSVQTPQTVSGTITDGIVFVGLLSGVPVDGTFNGVLSSIASSKIFAGARGRFNANATVTGTHTNEGATAVGVGATLTADVLTDTGTYVSDARDVNADGVADAAEFGAFADSGANGTLSLGNLQVNVTGQVGVGTAQWLTGITTGGGTLADNSLQYTFTVADNAGNSDITVARASIASLGTGTSGNTALGTTLDGLAASTDTEIVALLDAIAAAPDAESFNEALEAIQPAVDGGNVMGALNMVNTAANVTNSRLASLRTGDATSGMATGNVVSGVRGWFQGFASAGDQDRRDGIDGYDADSFGIAAGVDTENMIENAVIGLGVSWADTEVDSKASNNASTDIDSYQVSLYGDFDVDDRTYVNGMVAYSRHDNDTTRNPAAGLTAKGDFDADQYTVRTELGRDYQHGETTLSPSFLAHWTHYSPDSYTETGAGGANLTVDGEDIDVFELGVGVSAGWEHQNADGSVIEPEIRVGYRYDLVGDEIETTSTFQGGGAAFKSTGADPAQSTFNLGGGVKYYNTDNWEFTANYDFEIKEDYDSHAGFLRAGYKF